MNLDSHAVYVVFSDGGSASMRGAASAAAVVSWVWRSAGAPAIVLPRWSTDDATTAEMMMRAMYEALVPGGGSPEFAVQEAAKRIRAAEETRAPFYWAAWQVVGR
jgi:CHAT domain-containing protein